MIEISRKLWLDIETGDSDELATALARAILNGTIVVLENESA